MSNTIGKAGLPIPDWKQEERKSLEEKLNKVESRIEETRLVVQASSNGSTTYISVVDPKTALVRLATTYYLHSNEIFKKGDDISITDEIQKFEKLIEIVGKKIKALTVNHKIIERPTVSGKQASSVEAEFMIKMEF